MSLGFTRVSTSNLSPSGTTSMIFWPGCTYWPTVVTWTSLTTPSTGERNSVRPLAGRRAMSASLTAIFAVDLAALVERRLAELEIGLGGLRLRFAHRRHGLALLLARRGDPALQVDDLAALVQKVGLRNDVLRRQRLEHRDLLLGEREAALEAADRRRGFAGFAPRLVGGSRASPAILLRSADSRAKRSACSPAQSVPVQATFRPVPSAVRREDARLQRLVLGLDLRGSRDCRAAPAARPLCTCWPERDEDLAHRRRLGRGDHLQLARRDDLALPARDFVDLARGSPTAGRSRTAPTDATMIIREPVIGLRCLIAGPTKGSVAMIDAYSRT